MVPTPHGTLAMRSSATYRRGTLALICFLRRVTDRVVYG
jgi:hypothetical protein